MTREPPSTGDLVATEDDLVIIVEDAGEPSAAAPRPRWKIAVIDDDQAVQDGTRFALFDYELEGHGVELLSARSAAEGRALLAEHPDIAVVLLDVVMETEAAGLDLVDHIRRTLKNDVVRIILRTGQPGQAPERAIIVDYDINDYKAKTELTATKLFTTVTTALRSFDQLSRMEGTRRGLEMIIDATASLGDQRSVHRLAEGVLTQVASLLDLDCAGILVLREGHELPGPMSVLAGSGCYRDAVGRPTGAHLGADLLDVIEDAFKRRRTDFSTERTVLFIGSETGTEIVVVLDSRRHLTDTQRSLLGIFCNRLSAGIDALVLYGQLQEANRTLESRVAARTEDLAGANRRLLEQWGRVRRAKAFQNEVMSTVAHDLKNPLSVILGRAEILGQMLDRPDLPKERWRAQIEHMRDQASRMGAMIDRLVADAMADAHDVTIVRAAGDLADLVAEVVGANLTLAGRKGQRIEFRGVASLRACYDEDRLRDALDNLLSNAVKYSPPGAVIRVEAERQDGEAAISIVDEGPGLLPDDFLRLFGRFQRLSAKPTGGESSTGLGLFSAKRIVDLHGGQIAATSAGAGQGATFTIRLPLEEPD